MRNGFIPTDPYSNRKLDRDRLELPRTRRQLWQLCNSEQSTTARHRNDGPFGGSEDPLTNKGIFEYRKRSMRTESWLWESSQKRSKATAPRFTWRKPARLSLGRTSSVCREKEGRGKVGNSAAEVRKELDQS
jgi:hypothetical protein